jgi:transposase-like protein
VTNEDEAEESGTDHRLADEATVTCPHCGEAVVIALDPTGGSHQEYVEDCEVCCRPWQVHVHYAGGSVDVSVEAA